jgi:RNA polymerase sigma-70 factor (ECF subfamily)
MAMQAPITDEQVTTLVSRCQQGEASATEALYDLYADRLYRYLRARVRDADAAADLTTEVFVRMIQHIGSFRLNRARPASSFSAWLYRIAANLAADQHRGSRRYEPITLDEGLVGPARNPGPDAIAEQRDVTARLTEAINALSEEQRLVIIAKFAEGMSNAEVASFLGKTEGAVKALQHRALGALGRLLGAAER